MNEKNIKKDIKDKNNTLLLIRVEIFKAAKDIVENQHNLLKNIENINQWIKNMDRLRYEINMLYLLLKY